MATPLTWLQSAVTASYVFAIDNLCWPFYSRVVCARSQLDVGAKDTFDTPSTEMVLSTHMEIPLVAGSTFAVAVAAVNTAGTGTFSSPIVRA